MTIRVIFNMGLLTGPSSHVVYYSINRRKKKESVVYFRWRRIFFKEMIKRTKEYKLFIPLYMYVFFTSTCISRHANKKVNYHKTAGQTRLSMFFP